MPRSSERFLEPCPPAPRPVQTLGAAASRTSALRAASGAGALLLAGWLGSCSSGGSGGPGGGMQVASCVLGCSGPELGPLNCAVTTVFVNQDFWIEFSQPVDLSSVTKNTFQVVDTVNGQTPAGSFSLDPNNNRRVIFRPKLTFDSSGNPIFGLSPGNSYRISIPGTLANPQGPYIRSTGGQNNQVRLDCFISATAGINDPVPGAPSASVFLEQLVGGQVVSSVPAQGLQAAPLDSRLRVVFNDIMNPATLVNPATGVATFLKVSVDLDGNLEDGTDLLQLSGTYQLAIDENLKQTTVFFTPAGGFPSAGGDPLNPRRVVLELPATIVDLGSNPLANAGRVDFVTAAVPLAEAELAERFQDASKTSLLRSGTLLDPTAQSVQVEFGPNLEVLGQTTYTGRLLPGFGGGSGVLGDLRVPAGSVLTLSTGPTIPTVFGPTLTNGPVNALGQPTTDPAQIAAYHVRATLLDNYALTGQPAGSAQVSISDGVWEFSSLVIEAGGIVRIVGQNAPRVFARGELQLSGLIDLTGQQAPRQSSNVGLGGPGGLPGPAGGAGGRGADRPDSGGTSLINGILLLGFDQPPGTVFQIDGYRGLGRGGDTALPGDDLGSGGGGVHWPTVLPGPLVTNFGGFVPNGICTSAQGGAPGAGGSYSFFGTAGAWAALTPLVGVPPAPPLANPGGSLLSAAAANLDPDKGGRLLGGAGGGGGGVGIIGTKSNGFAFNCNTPIPPFSLQLQEYYDHSGSGGGGGGGAIQFQAGRRATVEGRLDVSGGEGGSADITSVAIAARYAAPGGGGSGGAVLLQSLEIALANIVGVIDISGGEGGTNPNVGDYRGGVGGPGIVRLEKSPLASLSPTTEGAKILTYLGAPPAGFSSSDFLSITNWTPVATGPGASSGYQSCWLAPQGAFFEVDYVADDLSAADPEDWSFGWNLKVLIGNGPDSIISVDDYRGTNGLTYKLLGQDLASLLGNELGASALVVRFQGVRAVGPVSNLCDAEPGTQPNLLTGSETPWLNSPQEVASYWATQLPGNPGLAAKRKANLIRAQILFDRSAPNAGVVQGVVELTIRCIPD